jgi:transposase-like protein
MARTWANLFDMQKAIPTERAAVEYFRKIHWKGGEYCPHCQHKEVYHFSDGVTFKCAACRKRFSIRVGTIFEDSKVPLQKWLFAIWMLTSHKKGIASTTLARDVGVTQKTAWFMLQRLRYAARTRSFNRQLRNDVEADDARIGGKDRWKHKHQRGKNNKVVVFGMLERGGELRAKPLNNLGEVLDEIRSNIKAKSRLITDDWPGYVGLKGRFDHQAVNHSAGQYGREDNIHTNSIEGFWSLMKRQIYGIHHWVSDKHLAKYVDEAVFRYNRREVTEVDRVAEFIGRVHGRLTYKALIA